LSAKGLVKLTIFDVLGRNIQTLINKNQNAGNYKTEFNGQNLTSGIYYCVLEVNGLKKAENKMIFLK